MMGLTRRQRELLIFLRAHRREHGRPPSFEEMRVTLDVRFKGGLFRLLDALEDKGYIRRTRAHIRAIEVLKSEDEHALNCECVECGPFARYIEQLKLIQGLKILPPVAVANARLVGIRLLSQATRNALLGRQHAAPRTRKTALPTGAGR